MEFIKPKITLPDLFPGHDFTSFTKAGKTLPVTPTSVPDITPGIVTGEILEKASASGTSSNWITALKWTGGILAAVGIGYLLHKHFKSKEDKK